MKYSILCLILFLILSTSCTGLKPAAIIGTGKSAGPETTAVDLDSYYQIFYVASQGSNMQGDGTWQNPYESVNRALSAISHAAADQRIAVLVAEGTYTEKTIHMKRFVDLYGGFSRSDRGKRNIRKYRTILDGGGKYRVLIGADSSRLDGFVISRGSVRGKGAGLLCDGVSPLITNNVFTGNITLKPEQWSPVLRHEIANDGGAVYGRNGASPVIENNIFYRNKTQAGRGAGIALDGHCGGRIASNVFLYNIAGIDDPMRSSDGGAISIFQWSAPVIENNLIIQNEARARNDGGGIFSLYWSSPKIMKNTIIGNRCGDDGGGIFTGGQNHHDEVPPVFDPIPEKEEFTIRINGNVFAGNNEAVEVSMESRCEFLENIVFLNGAPDTHPAGVYFQRSEARIEHNIILDPFLINFQTFDNKSSSEGLQPSVIRKNQFWGELLLGTQVVVEDNFVLDNFDPRQGNFPELDDHRIHLYPDAIIYGDHIVRQVFTTKLILASRTLKKDILAGRVVKAGDKWGVVKSNDKYQLELWGDFTGESDFMIFPIYGYPAKL